MKRILVIIVTYNGERWISRCLRSALQSSAIADILVVDNASSDDTMTIVDAVTANNADRVRVMRMEENMGFGAANNLGLRMAVAENYDYVYLLNQDAYLEADTLEKLVQVHQWNPQFGVLSPFQADDKGNADTLFAKHTGIKQMSRLDIPVEVNFVMAAHWFIPVDALKSVGAFSPVFHHYGEDENWIDRLHYHGLKAGVVTSVKGIHDRAQRQSSKEQQCRRKCLIPIIRMSRPRGAWSLMKSMIWLVGCSIKNFNLIPVQSIPELWERLAEIHKNRTMSMAEGAFLDHQS